MAGTNNVLIAIWDLESFNGIAAFMMTSEQLFQSVHLSPSLRFIFVGVI